MTKVSEAVDQFIRKDPIAKEALIRGLLNMSAYAKEIKPIIEDECLKPVQTGTIVVTLSRIQVELLSENPFMPPVHIQNFSVKSGLCEITYNKTQNVLEKRALLDNEHISKQRFFTVTEGLSEITIICSCDMRKKITDHFGTTPKIMFDNLVAITCTLSEAYLEMPNALFSLTASLATHHINIIEIVSTSTEISYILRAQDLDEAVRALNSHFYKKTE